MEERRILLVEDELKIADTLKLGLSENGYEVEVAYALRVESWGNGLATEMARAAVQVAFANLGLPDLVAFTLPTNVASRRVMEKAGFAFERDVVHADMPHVLYRLTASSRI